MKLKLDRSRGLKFERNPPCLYLDWNVSVKDTDGQKEKENRIKENKKREKNDTQKVDKHFSRTITEKEGKEMDRPERKRREKEGRQRKDVKMK